jgi:cell division protein FtsN
VKTERRHAPRMTVNGVAYVNLDPDNGGIILNVSEGGLCFQSRTPVHGVETIRFWFSYRSQRIEARVGQAWTNEPSGGGVSRFIEVCSELAWIDDTRKRGGLRFKNLPQVAREQIRDWMHEPALVHVNQKPAQQFSSLKRLYGSLAPVVSAGLQELSRQIQAARLRTGFSGGLVSGILLSAVLVVLISLLIHSHRLGDSLVQLGELLGGRSWSQPLSTAPPPNSQESSSTSPRLQPMPSERETVSAGPQAVAAPIQAPSLEKLPPAISPPVAKAREVKLEVEGHGTPSVSRADARPSVPRIVAGARPPAEPDVSMLWTPAPEIELASRLAVHAEPSKAAGTLIDPEKYLEIGKFKEKPLADKQVGNLSQLDFPAKVFQNSRLFGKSYQVLVGPYGTDSEAEAVHKDLARRGFTPRSYERGKRNFTLRPGLKVGGTHLPVGDCVISWESYIPDAIVKIEAPRGERVTLEGKWVKQTGKYAQDAIAYQKDLDGSLALVEIHFSGLRQTLVFARGTSR